MDRVPAIECVATGHAGSGMGMTLWLISMVLFVVSSLLWIELHRDRDQPPHEGHEHDTFALDDLGFLITAVLGVLSFPVPSLRWCCCPWTVPWEQPLPE